MIIARAVDPRSHSWPTIKDFLFSANDPPSSHDPFNNLFSIDLFNSLLVLLAIPPSFSLRIRDILTLLLTSRSSVGLWSGLACQRAFDY
ncbi:hypothetical protein PGTUg99_033942 [Puccinia graminis f. sp. tritici]|uniref:Uncharacterized protein n=1 Tax=Puccinia graminis f. sp. tritici TaxID=56615 RepID=A0A5B0S1K1_PUCGR|nr:hypothetical protein PGTUg99_033942 [Puccinia graminis f. sp. tritici]